MLSGTISAATASGGDLVRSWPFTVTATDSEGAVATADLLLTVNGEPDAFYYDSSTGSLRDAQLTSGGWVIAALDGSSSTLAGHTSDVVGLVSSAVVIDGGPMVYYSDSTTNSLRAAWRADGASGGWRFETLDGPSSTLPGHTADHVGSAVSVTQLNGNPQVYYYDATRRSLRHAWWTGLAWQFETLDGAGSVIAGHDGDQVGSLGERHRDDQRPAGLLHRRDRPFAAARLVDVGRLALRDAGRPGFDALGPHRQPGRGDRLGHRLLDWRNAPSAPSGLIGRR